MKTYNKAQFIEEFGDKKASIAFMKPFGVNTVLNITDVEDIWQLIEMLPGEAVFDVYSFSAGLSNNKVLQKTFNEDKIGYYGEKSLYDYPISKTMATTFLLRLSVTTIAFRRV